MEQELEESIARYYETIADVVQGDSESQKELWVSTR